MRNEKLYRMLVDIFGEEYEVRNNQFRINCINPECKDKSGDLEISLDKGIFHCWECGYSGNIRQLLKDHMGWIPKIDKYVSAESLTRKKEEIKEEPKINTLKLPSEFVPLWENLDKLSLPGKRALKYIRGRLTDEEIKFYRIGYCGLGKYKNRIIVPVIERDQVVYFVARTFENEDPKYKNPNSKECGVGKEEIVFNLDSASKIGRAVVCEGVFDAMAVGKDGVAIFGTQLSKLQLLKIKVSGIKEFVVCLDLDAYDKALKIAKNIHENLYYGVRVVKIDKKDPAEMPREILRQKISEAKLHEWGKIELA